MSSTTVKMYGGGGGASSSSASSSSGVQRVTMFGVTVPEDGEILDDNASDAGTAPLEYDVDDLGLPRDPKLKWIFPPETPTPSTKMGMSVQDEATLRRVGIQFIGGIHRDLCPGKYGQLHSGLGQPAAPPPRIICTAAVYFHRFFMFHPFQIFHPIEIAGACYYLASKILECPKNCEEIIRIIRFQLNGFKTGTIFDRLLVGLDVDPTAGISDVKNLICRMENVLMQTLNFEHTVELPFNHHVDKCLTGFKSLSSEMMSKFKLRLYYYYEESLSSTICLHWNARTIAMAFTILACNKEKVPVRTWDGLIMDPDAFVHDNFRLSRDTVRTVCDILTSVITSKGQCCDLDTCTRIINRSFNPVQ